MEEIIFLLIIPIAIMLILLMLDFPIYLAILGPTIYLQVFVNDITLQKTFVTMVMGIMKPSILAVPFFVVAGNLISASGIGERLINFIMPKLRAIRGGVPLSSILANAFFGAISGSAPAAVATIGKLTFKPLVKYSGEQMALGVTTSSGCIATIIPPSISLIFFGIATETSIGQLFMAGFIPGLVMVAIVGAYVIVATKSRPVFGEQIAKEGFLKILPVLLMPVVVLGGIYGGFFTPVEAGAVSAAYALVAAVFYRELTWEKLKFCLRESTDTVGRLFILVACSLAFAEALTLSGITALINDLIGGLPVIIFLILLNIVLLVAGFFFEPGSIVLILAPIFFPVAVNMGIHPLHLGIIFAVNVAIGMFTPPFGLNIFVVQGVLEQPFEKISRAVVPFIVVYLVSLMIITFVPAISLWLPSMLR